MMADEYIRRAEALEITTSRKRRKKTERWMRRLGME